MPNVNGTNAPGAGQYGGYTPAGGGGDGGGGQVPGTMLSANGDLSLERVAQVLSDIMKKANSNLDKALQKADNSQSGGNQGNTSMIQAQQAQGSLSSITNQATSLLSGLEEGLKAIGQNTK